MGGKRIVMGLIGHDVHVVANRVLDVALRDRGFEVVNLRTDNTVDDFVDAVVETEAHAVLMSSLNGEAENWCRGVRARMAEAGFGDILLHIGGNLVVGTRDHDEVLALFKGYGFDRVFYGPTDFNVAMDLLQEDLGDG